MSSEVICYNKNMKQHSNSQHYCIIPKQFIPNMDCKYMLRIIN